MKIEIHSTVLDALMTPYFYDSIKIFANEFSKSDNSIMKIQLYSDYFSANASYPFIDNHYVYYPLTVVHKEKWEIVWIYWDNVADLLSIKEIPFSILQMADIRLCDFVPNNFENYIKKSKLVFKQNKHFAQPIIHTILPLKNRGKINQNFADTLAEQISIELIEMGCINLNYKWSLEISDADTTHHINGKNYRVVKLKNSIAECIYLGICWNEKINTFDYITDDTKVFCLTEEPFDNRVCSLSDVCAFINNNGF